jgi:hypothetical protein
MQQTGGGDSHAIARYGKSWHGVRSGSWLSRSHGANARPNKNQGVKGSGARSPLPCVLTVYDILLHKVMPCSPLIVVAEKRSVAGLNKHGKVSHGQTSIPVFARDYEGTSLEMLLKYSAKESMVL